MTPIFSERYGSITETDAEVMDACIEQACKTFYHETLNVCEVGMFAGGTANGIRLKMQALGKGINYYGIDAGYIRDPQLPFEGATVIKGRSEEVFHLVPGPLHFLFIDGCHCRNHVILDTLNYASKIVSGGFVLYHDASPEVQGTDRQPCAPDMDAPQFYVSVLEGLAMLHMFGWQIFLHKYKTGCPLGGIMAYKKI